MPLFHFCTESVTDPNENTFLLSDTLLFQYKEVYTNVENSISLKFVSVLSDGRCPVDMMCFWEGDAELNFIFSDRNENVSFNLHTAFNYFTKDTVILGYHTELLDVYPYPHSKKEFNAKDYKAKIVINKSIKN